MRSSKEKREPPSSPCSTSCGFPVFKSSIFYFSFEVPKSRLPFLKDSSLVGCYAVSISKKLQTFRKDATAFLSQAFVPLLGVLISEPLILFFLSFFFSVRTDNSNCALSSKKTRKICVKRIATKCYLTLHSRCERHRPGQI